MGGHILFGTSLVALALKDIHKQPSLSPKKWLMGSKASSLGRTTPLASISSGLMIFQILLHWMDVGSISSWACIKGEFYPQRSSSGLSRKWMIFVVVQENGSANGLDTSDKSLTKVVSFEKLNPKTNPNYLGLVDVIEPCARYITPPLIQLPLSNHLFDLHTDSKNVEIVHNRCTYLIPTPRCRTPIVEFD